MIPRQWNGPSVNNALLALTSVVAYDRLHSDVLLAEKEICTSFYQRNSCHNLSGAPNGSFRWNICSAHLNRLRYSDLIAVKNSDFFSETSPQTFVTMGLNSYCFPRNKYVECKIRSASIFGQPLTARKFSG